MFFTPAVTERKVFCGSGKLDSITDARVKLSMIVPDLNETCRKSRVPVSRTCGVVRSAL